ncbi:MAG: GNAT family N-acetyltransferase [Gemmatimonadaceae bacterium]
MDTQAERGEFSITWDSDAVDLDAVHAFLTRAYWSEGIPAALVARAIAGSIPFSLFHGSTQIGFARVITDRATYGYLADVYVLEAYRGQGLGRWLVDVIMQHPDLQSLRRFALVTRDAHDLYRQVGFAPLAAPERHMEIVRPAKAR